MNDKLICIVGRPNVGKSTLFNRLLGRRKALVHDNPGVTRDKLYGRIKTSSGGCLTIIDTGGLTGEDEGLAKGIGDAVMAAVEESDMVLFVVDGRDGLLPLDEEIARELRKKGKEITVVVNKMEGNGDISQFMTLGFERVLPVSAEHGKGIVDLWNTITGEKTASLKRKIIEDRGIKFVFTGRPNVGKSSLANAVLGREEVIVHDKPGTTRDPVDISFEHRGKNFVLIDTAGIRRRTRILEKEESLAVLFALRSIEAADVAVLVLDSSEPVAEQDQRIARAVLDAKRGLVVCLNKTDVHVSPQDGNKLFNIKTSMDRLRFVDFCPMVKTSAKEGKGINSLLNAIVRVYGNLGRRIGTGKLNRFMKEILSEQPPRDRSGRPFKIYYAVQSDVRPPVFTFFGNSDDPSPAYSGYIENRFRTLADFSGVPLTLVFKRKERKPKKFKKRF